MMIEPLRAGGGQIPGDRRGGQHEFTAWLTTAT
jgi:hypothetical protein